jgi:hypothetical protein
LISAFGLKLSSAIQTASVRIREYQVPDGFRASGTVGHPRRMTTGTSRVDRFERRTEWPLAVLALVFLAAYAWPILQPDISPAWKHVCTVIDILIWVVFVVEFVARVVRSERRV